MRARLGPPLQWGIPSHRGPKRAAVGDAHTAHGFGLARLLRCRHPPWESELEGSGGGPASDRALWRASPPEGGYLGGPPERRPARISWIPGGVLGTVGDGPGGRNVAPTGGSAVEDLAGEGVGFKRH